MTQRSCQGKQGGPCSNCRLSVLGLFSQHKQEAPGFKQGRCRMAALGTASAHSELLGIWLSVATPPTPLPGSLTDQEPVSQAS